MTIERDATADVDAGGTIARHADGFQDGGQFGVAGNPRASELKAAGGSLEDFDGPSLP